jgi:ATP-dependent helicase/DNAse subunit B
MDDLMRKHWGQAIFLVPTRQIGARRTERLILEGNLSGAWGRRVLTFEDFVRWLLDTAHTDATAIDDFERTMLLQDAVARVKQAGGLEVLGEAAESAGFLTHMQRIVAQLKQAAVDPSDFRRRSARRRHASPLDAVVADVYDAYQSMLIEAKLYDRQGTYWEANDLCRKGRPEVLKDVRVLLLDGFDDFTPSEFRLLEALERHLDLLVFGLNYDPAPGRRDLYRLTAATAERIRERFNAAERIFEATDPDSYTKYVSANLFWRDKPNLPGALREDIEVQPCPGQIAEVEHVGRRVKSLLLEGVPAEEIAVIYRDLQGVAATIRSAFGEFGVPLRVVKKPCLGDSAVCGFLLDFIETIDSWEREKVVDILVSPWFRPEEQPESPYRGEIPSLARFAQIVSGYREWNDRLAGLLKRFEKLEQTEQPDDDPDRSDPGLLQRYLRHMPQAPEAAKALYARYDLMSTVAMRLPTQVSVCEHILALERLIVDCGIPEAIEAHPVYELRRAEKSALETLRSLLAQIYSWCEASRNDGKVSRAEFLIRLRKAFRDTAYEVPDSGRGVACLDAEAARGLRFDHVFFCGVNEGEVPRPSPSNAVYSDEDLEELEQAGIRLDGKRGRSDHELLLFHRVLDVPRRRLVITYRTLSPDGKDLRPSPFVEDLLELFPPDAKILKPAIPASAFVPKPADVASARDLRNAAFAGASGLRRAFADEFRGTERGAKIEKRRYLPVPFDAYDGVVANDGLRAQLERLFGPEHTYSVSQIEAYAACPFAYFADRVLGILEVEPPTEDFDARIVGTILHDVLQVFHHHYRDKAVADLPEEEASQAMADLADELFRKNIRYNGSVSAGVAAVIKAQVDSILQRYLRQARSDKEQRWKPAHFELTFGEQRESFYDPKDSPEPLAIDTPEGKVLFKGRIDRVDLDGDRARIIDYKSGSPPSPGDIKACLSIQLSVYALAVEEHLLKGVACEEACFLQLGKDKTVSGIDGAGKDGGWPQRRANAIDAMARYIRGIRNGEFAPAPRRKGCQYCPVSKACRHETARIERKGAEDADAADA